MEILKELKLSPNGSYNYNNINPSSITIYTSKKSNLSILDLEEIDKANSKITFGGHFYVRKDGEIHEGRPLSAVGDFAYDPYHKFNLNYDNIGICIEGDFNNEFITDIQKTSIIELLKYLKNLYNPEIKLYFLRELDLGDDPGILFPYGDIISYFYELFSIEYRVIGNLEYYKLGCRELYVRDDNFFEGTDVFGIQTILRNLGIYNSYPNGIYDHFTEKAVYQYQLNNNMVPTGIASIKTLNRIINESKKLNKIKFKRLLYKEEGDTFLEGNDILQLQKVLNNKRYICDLSGNYDDKTINAVKEFQLNNHIDVDGMVGPITWKLIMDENSSNKFRILKRTSDLMYGNDVEELQKKLQEIGFISVPITGVFDILTEKAVIQYQVKNGLQITGVVDKSLWDMIFNS